MPLALGGDSNVSLYPFGCGLVPLLPAWQETFPIVFLFSILFSGVGSGEERLFLKIEGGGLIRRGSEEWERTEAGRVSVGS